MFAESIEAWALGPAVPEAYDAYSQYGKNPLPFDNTQEILQLSDEEEDLFAEVFELYYKYSAFGLAMKTHGEMPWKSTPTGEGNVITHDKLKSYFKTKIE